MPHTNNFDIELVLLVGILVCFFFVLILAKLITFWSEFYDELRYLKDEIRRTGGDERIYWMRRKRRLWLSLIPFVKYR